MKKVCHLIMVYKDPQQVERLINALQHPECDIFMHIDKKVDIEQFKNINNANQVKFIKNRVQVNWGGYSLIKAISNSIEEIRLSGNHYDFINLLSAQDYPIKKINDILCFLENNKGKCFISYNEITDKKWWNENIIRITRYHFNDFPFKGKFILQKIANIILPRRKFPIEWKLYGGNCSSWWILSAEVAYFFVDTMRSNRRLRKFAQLTWAPDEYIYATVIMNSKYKNFTVNNNFRYIDWSERKANPKVLKFDDFPKLIKTDNFFARKFDIKVNTQILDLIDDVLR